MDNVVIGKKHGLGEVVEPQPKRGNHGPLPVAEVPKVGAIEGEVSDAALACLAGNAWDTTKTSPAVLMKDTAAQLDQSNTETHLHDNNITGSSPDGTLPGSSSPADTSLGGTSGCTSPGSSLPGVSASVVSGISSPSSTTTIFSNTSIQGADGLIQGGTVTPFVPEIWSSNRQGLCDGVHEHFNSHQSGSHTKQGRLLGYLLDAEARPRDVLGAEVIISTMAGGRQEDSNSGQRGYKKDQKESHYVKDARNTRDAQQPVLVIIGSSHPFYTSRANTSAKQGVIPYKSAVSVADAPHRYNVLGWFYITEVRQEKYGGLKGDVTIWVMRFDKVEVNKASWWYPKDQKPSDPTGYALPGAVTVPSQMCSGTCKTASDHVFEQGWTCLEATCTKFFEFPANVDTDHLQYSSDYLRHRKQFKAAELPELPASLPDPVYDGELQFGTEVAFRKGMVCPNCGNCVSRVYWDRWECPTDWKGGCGFRHYAKVLDYPLDAVLDETRVQEEKYRPRTHAFPTIHLEQSMTQVDWAIGGYRVSSYVTCDKDDKALGTISHFQATREICRQQDGPDMIFAEIQKVASHQGEPTPVDLKRSPAKNGGSHMETLTRHFAQNFGAPYKYQVAVDSVPFRDAPDVILKALMRTTWAGQAVAAKSQELLDGFDRSESCPTDKYQDSNELLLLGYMESDRISYHDDGEKDLGDTVATFAVGSPSIFSVKPKAEKKSGMPPGNGPEKSVIRFMVNHGDIVIMHGAEIHKVYVHQVEPFGKRRFALTSRYIDPQKIKEDDRRAVAVEDGRIPARAQTFVYNGH